MKAIAFNLDRDLFENVITKLRNWLCLQTTDRSSLGVLEIECVGRDESICPLGNEINKSSSTCIYHDLHCMNTREKGRKGGKL